MATDLIEQRAAILADKIENRKSKIENPRQRNAWLVHLALIVLSVVFIFPLFWLISTSLKPLSETMKMPPTYIPSHIQWGNYVRAITYGSDKLGYIPFLVYARNTLL